MALNHYSVFYYGFTIDEGNNLIDFKEGAGPEKTAQIPVGSYTMTKFFDVLIAALNGVSALDWAYTLDRSTRIVTITSSGTASLLIASGTNTVNVPRDLIGFNNVDRLNQTSFVGDFAAGYEYNPQFPLQDYKGKDKNKKLVNAVVTKSATGDTVSVQSFGVDRLIKCNIKYITNLPTDGKLRGNDQAVEECISFMDYIVEKKPFEFMENENDRSAFDKVYLESTASGSDGTQYELTEYVDRNLPGYFETGMLTFKVINLE